jgi:pimeloyl-ACP methyl ester carboxylesterase
MTPAALPAYFRRIDSRALDGLIGRVRVSAMPGAARARRVFLLGAEDAPTVVLLPPYGMTCLLLMPLAARLATRYRVLMWESAGCPDGECPVRDADFTLEFQAQEFRTTVAQFAPEEYHVVGWCQAAQLVAHAIARGGARPASISWIAPGGFGHAALKSEFERCALPIYLEIERQGVDEARKLGAILDKYRGLAIEPGFAGERLTMLHLADPEATHVFSRYMKCFRDNIPVSHELLPAALSVRVPTLIIHARDDTYSHYSESVEIAKMSSQVRLELLARGGHLMLFDEPATPASLVLDFLDSHVSVAEY